MEKIAFIIGESFLYWSPIIIAMAAVAAMLMYAAVYLKRDGNVFALSCSILLSILFSIPLARLVHWYCRTNTYTSFASAMTDYTQGGFALMGAFGGCLLAALLLRLLMVSDSLPRMLDGMVIGGGVGIAVGRLASLFNASDRGMVLPDSVGLPFAFPVTNAVSGGLENRLATFIIQSILTGAIVLLLMIFIAWCASRKKKIPDGDVCLIFLLCYGAIQIICDSTRYDSLFFRSNGFVSIVQILGLVALVIPIAVFSIRMVLRKGVQWWEFLLWIATLGMMGLAGYMEYYVQRHGSEAAFAYSVMGVCLVGIVLLALVMRGLGLHGKVRAKVKGKYAR